MKARNDSYDESSGEEWGGRKKNRKRKDSSDDDDSDFEKPQPKMINMIVGKSKRLKRR